MPTHQSAETPDIATSLTLPEAATMLRVHEATVRRWIKSGRLPAVQVGIAGHYRIRRVDLDTMVRGVV